jgi:hypothetical protein
MGWRGNILYVTHVTGDFTCCEWPKDMNVFFEHLTKCGAGNCNEKQCEEYGVEEG